MQLHLPDHSPSSTRVPVKEINGSTELIYDQFCNRPSVLNMWSKDELPDYRNAWPKVLVTDESKGKGKTLNATGYRLIYVH